MMIWKQHFHKKTQSSEITVLRGKIKLLKKLDKNLALFGAGNHRYMVNCNLSEKSLVDYEEKYSLTIPKEYRSFLAELGDGGCGPFYGLLPLHDNDGMLQNSGTSDDEGLDKNFPFTQRTPLRLEDDAELIAIEENRYKYYEAGMLEEEEKLDQAYNERENYFYALATKGIKFLCHEGCGMYSVLVMKGTEAGTVWHLDFSGGAAWGCGILPLVNPDNGRPLDFFTWYNIWLDRAIQSCQAKQKDIWSYMQYASCLDGID